MRILLAIDGSSSSTAAIHDVAKQMWPENTIVQVVTAHLPLQPSTWRGATPSVLDEIDQNKRADANQYLMDAVRILEQSTSRLIVTHKILEGSPKEVIIDEALRWEASMIVVGSHGHGAIRSVFLGSVSLHIVLNAPCSVWLVRSSTGHIDPDLPHTDL